MNYEETSEIAMILISKAGSSRSESMLAIKEAKKLNFEKANNHLYEAKKFLIEAHDIQTNLITSEAREENLHINLLLIHAQDHLSIAIIAQDFAKELVDLYRRNNL